MRMDERKQTLRFHGKVRLFPFCQKAIVDPRRSGRSLHLLLIFPSWEPRFCRLCSNNFSVCEGCQLLERKQRLWKSQLKPTRDSDARGMDLNFACGWRRFVGPSKSESADKNLVKFIHNPEAFAEHLSSELVVLTILRIQTRVFADKCCIGVKCNIEMPRTDWHFSSRIFFLEPGTFFICQQIILMNREIAANELKGCRKQTSLWFLSALLPANLDKKY